MTSNLRRSLAPSLAAAAVCCAAACSRSSGPNIPTEAVVSLDREPVLLPAAYVGTDQNESLQILNQGRTTLTLSHVKLLSADGGALPGNSPFSQPTVAVAAADAGTSLPLQVTGLQAAFVQFTYAPRGAGRTTAMLVVDSDAPARPHLVTTVSACAALVDGGGPSCACPADAGPDGGC